MKTMLIVYSGFAFAFAVLAGMFIGQAVCYDNWISLSYTALLSVVSLIYFMRIIRMALSKPKKGGE